MSVPSVILQQPEVCTDKEGVSPSDGHYTFFSGVSIFCYFGLIILLLWLSVAIQAHTEPVQAPVKNSFRFP